MDSGRRRDLERLFLEVCDLPQDERQKVLDRNCVDPELRRKLEAFLNETVSSEFLAPVLRPDRGLRELVRAITHPEHDGVARTVPEGVAPPRSVPHPLCADQITRIAKYTILRELGRGGMGVVYLAHDDRLRRNVAIKWLISTERELVHRFIDEARATASCRHDNIVVIHEVDEHEGHPYIVFEYLRGRTVRQWMRDQDQPLSLVQVLDIVTPVVRALECAHSMRVIHRDLKPENIMITEAGAVKVVDFGIAKVLSNAYVTTRHPGSPESHLTRTQKGTLIGTMPYMSPEQWGADDIDHRTDIWAVGILLHELLTGRHPLAPIDDIEKLRAVGDLNLPMPRLTDVDPSLSVLAEITNDCLEKRKQFRISTASDLLDRLERARGSRSRASTPLPTKISFQEVIAALLLSPDLPSLFPTQVKPGTRPGLEGYRILCVDDEPVSCDLLKKNLGTENHVETAANYYEALELLRNQPFDVMLTDNAMPGRTGAELALQAGMEYPDLAVILVTGFDDSPAVMESLESPDSPIVDIIPKPWASVDLQRRILEACDPTFSAVVRQAWPDYWATKPVLLKCRRIIRGFMRKFGGSDIFQTALRHKMKERVHAFARDTIFGQPGASAAASLRVSLARIWRFMERVQVGATKGLIRYLESMNRDLADDSPRIDFSIDVVPPISILERLPDIQTVLTLSAIELVDNAKDALGSKGQIRVHLRERSCTRAMLLKVWCDGPPIPSEVEARIFEEGVSTKGPGRGLGLSIVKAMVKRFRGEVQLLQHDGVSFLVTVPLPDDGAH
jgi:serine/threonine protein kinase